MFAEFFFLSDSYVRFFIPPSVAHSICHSIASCLQYLTPLPNDFRYFMPLLQQFAVVGGGIEYFQTSITPDYSPRSGNVKAKIIQPPCAQTLLRM